jgi:hypothetical protein
MYVSAPRVSVRSLLVEENVLIATRTAYGGGMHITASTSSTISRCLIRNNTARVSGIAASDAYGGGLQVDGGGTLSMTMTQIIANSVAATGKLTGSMNVWGGGLMIADSDAVIVSCNFTVNSAWSRFNVSTVTANVHGGGAMIYQSDAVFNDTWVVGNHARTLGAASSSSISRGGGLAMRAARAYCHRLYVALNLATSVGTVIGGGITVWSTGWEHAILVLRGSVVARNTAVCSVSAYGGGIHFSAGNLGSPLTIETTILRNNTVQASGTSAYSAEGGGLRAYVTVSYLRSLVVSGNSAILTGTRSTNAYTRGGGFSFESGGAVYVHGCNVTSNRAWIQTNLTSVTGYAAGGGISRTSGDIYVNNSRIVGNSAVHSGEGDSTTQARGGGFHVRHGAVFCSSIEVLENRVSSPYNVYGGGASVAAEKTWADAEAHIAKSIFVGNVATAGISGAGGGFYCAVSGSVPRPINFNGDVTVSNNTVRVWGRSLTADASQASGGGLYLGVTSCVFKGVRVSGNSAMLGNTSLSTAYARGGGIAEVGGLVEMTNCTISANFASIQARSGSSTLMAQGGGVFGWSTRLSCNDSTVIGNRVIQTGVAGSSSEVCFAVHVCINMFPYTYVCELLELIHAASRPWRAHRLD